MGPGSPPFDSPSAVERGPRVRVPAFWALLSPGPTLPGLGLDPSLWVSGLLSCVSHFLSLVPHRGSWVRPPTHYPPPRCHPDVLHPGEHRWPCLPWITRTYRPEVSVELVVLPQVGQEAGGRSGGLLTVGAGREQQSAE